jgi:hypothetical protein
MSGDGWSEATLGGSQRAIKRPVVAPGPLADLKALVYELYLQAGMPKLTQFGALYQLYLDAASPRPGPTQKWAEHAGEPGMPGRDTIHRIIGSAALPPSQADLLTVVAVLARAARWDPDDAVTRAKDLWVAASMARPVGVPLGKVSDPFALEVHRPVEVEGAAGLPVLPAYVPRAHDVQLAELAEAAAGGASGLGVLVGDSSTGKTRACWEALGPLRRAGGWRLWHPIAPSRPEGLLEGLAGVGPRTLVWLNEAQEYLGGSDGEQVAARLRVLVSDGARSPVLVLGTLWRSHWDDLTRRTDRGTDAHAHARELLSGRDITVPAAFSPAEVALLGRAGDLRLAAAADARDGRVTQFLAGAPELLARYRNAPPAARALVDAAMDARRLGTGEAIPLAFLEAAVPGYLDDTEWEEAADDWLEQAMAYTAEPCKGVHGPLTRIRPRPGTSAATGGVPAYRLADYLDQHGRRVRREEIPSASFWAAAASHADPTDLLVLGSDAEARGLLRDAARLYKKACARYPSAGASLITLLHRVDPGDLRPADWAAGHASLGNPFGVDNLLRALRQVRGDAQVSVLLDRDPAAHVSLDNPFGVALLLGRLREAAAREQATALARRAAAYARFENLRAVADLLRALRQAGATGQVTVLATRAATHASHDNPEGVAILLGALREAGADAQVSVLLARDPAAHASLDNALGVASLLRALREAGADAQVSVLLARDPAAHASLDNPLGVASLLRALVAEKAAGQVSALLDRDPAAQVNLDIPRYLARLLESLARAGADGQVSALASRIAAHSSVNHLTDLVWNLEEFDMEGLAAQILQDRDPNAHLDLDDPASVAFELREARTIGQVSALLDRDPAAYVSLDNPSGVASLLRALVAAGADRQVSALLDRDPAAYVSLDNPFGVASLLEELREAGADAQLTVLAARAAAYARLEGSSYAVGVSNLLRELRMTDTRTQASELIERLPGAGQFELFCKQEGRAGHFRFGREADGRPAKPWGWADLG